MINLFLWFSEFSAYPVYLYMNDNIAIYQKDDSLDFYFCQGLSTCSQSNPPIFFLIHEV